jgi:integrase
MKIYKKEGSWHVYFRYQDPVTGESKRFRRSTGPRTTKSEAQGKGHQWYEAATAPPTAPQQKRKRAAFSGFAKLWLDRHVLVNNKPTTVRATKRILKNHLVPFFGDRDLRVIEAEDVATYKALKVKTLAPKTVNNHIGVLSRLYRDAVQWRYCEVSPAAGSGMLKVPPRPLRFWDKQQGHAFLVAVQRHEPRWHPLFMTALRTGLRQGELLGLEWSDVDFNNSQVHVRRTFTEGQVTSPKNNKTRAVPMPRDLEAMLRRTPRHLFSSLVFHRSDGSHLSNNCLWKPMQRNIKRAGVPKIAFHDMRHSYASQLVMGGVPMKAIQEYLGHADITTTMRYAHLSPSARADFVQVLCDEDLSTICPRSVHDGKEGKPSTLIR